MLEKFIRRGKETRIWFFFHFFFWLRIEGFLFSLGSTRRATTTKKATRTLNNKLSSIFINDLTEAKAHDNVVEKHEWNCFPFYFIFFFSSFDAIDSWKWISRLLNGLRYLAFLCFIFAFLFAFLFFSLRPETIISIDYLPVCVCVSFIFKCFFVRIFFFFRISFIRFIFGGFFHSRFFAKYMLRSHGKIYTRCLELNEVPKAEK